MPRLALSASLVALALLAVATLPGAAAQSQLHVRSVGEILVDAFGRANGDNLVTSIREADGTIEGFSTGDASGVVFREIRIDGFRAAEKIQGVGSPKLTLRGSNAVVTLHDTLRSLVSVRVLHPTSVTYSLAEGVRATQEGASGGVVRLTDATGAELGHLVAVGSAGAHALGEAVHVKAGEVLVRAQSGTDVVFLAKPAHERGTVSAHHQALVDALAHGALASQYVTALEGSAVRASQLDHDARAAIRSAADASGVVSSSIRGASPARLLSYDLAYETLPARSASDVAVYVDGQLATRAASARDVLAHAKSGLPAFHAVVQGGRAAILASTASDAGEQRISIRASAHASTEPQARAEGSADDGSRVYGAFEHHPNGKLTGAFVSAVLPESRAHLLGFTSLAARAEVFRGVSVDGSATARFTASGADQMRIETPKADLTLADDAHATMLLAARAPVSAAYALAAGVTARLAAPDLVLLEGPAGGLGALVLAGPPGGALQLDANGDVEARLVPGSLLLYRGAADAHETEPSVLQGFARGEVGAQLLVGIHDGAPATRVTRYHDNIHVTVRPEGFGGFVVEHISKTDDAPRAFVFDARGASLLAKATTDIRVRIDGVVATAVPTPEEALDAAGFPRYHASTTPEGALRLVVNTGAATGRTASVAIESLVNEMARAQARTDAFGAFRLHHDGTAIGSFVALKAEKAAGAVAGFTLVGESRPVFASLVAGRSPYVAMGGDGTSALRFENREARLEFSDTTSGFAQVVATSDTSAAFRLASGLRAEQRGPSVVEILDASGAHVASLVLVGASAGSGIEERAGREVHGSLARGASILFRAHAGIESELSAAQRAMINEAMASGRIAGQVIVQTQAGAEAEAHALESTSRAGARGVATDARHAYGEITSAVTATYGAVSVVTAATKTRVDVTVSSAIETGQTLLVSLDPDTIPGMARGKAVIKFDGRAVGQAASYADILDPNDDGDAAEYFVLAGEAGTQVLVSIPSFSVHTVTLEEQPRHPNSLYMYATVFLGLLVVVESALLARHARLKKASRSQERRH